MVQGTADALAQAKTGYKAMQGLSNLIVAILLQGMADALAQAKTGYKAMQELERIKRTWNVTTGNVCLQQPLAVNKQPTCLVDALPCHCCLLHDKTLDMMHMAQMCVSSA